MIVGVESNFVLELTLGQTEAGDCAQILNLAEQRAIQLVIPGCALFEPYETLIRHSKERVHVSRALQKEIDQLTRSDIYAELRQPSKVVTRALLDSGDQQIELLAQTIDRIVEIATVVPLDSDVIRRSRAAQREHHMPPQDSVIFASIVQFLEAQGRDPKLFANKNHKDFATDPLEEELAKHNCKLLSRFAQARQFIENSVRT